LAASTATAEELEVVRLVNAERTRAGLWPLSLNSGLATAARNHNADMIATPFFGHTGSNGSSPSQRAAGAGFQPYGWGEAYVGENIAAGYASAAAVVEAWMNSSGHRANILKPEYREIGVGFTRNASCTPYCTYWTQDFGSQPMVLPVFVNDGAEQTTGTGVRVTVTNETVSSWGSLGPVQQVMLSCDPSFAGASWQPYAQRLTMSLPAGSGTRTVYARLRDGYGQEVRSFDSVTVFASNVKLDKKAFIPLVSFP
jgi:hypothetical protein